MVHLNTHNTNEIFFIRIFFFLLMACLLLVILIVTVLNINDSVSFDSGEIMAKIPQHDYKAPFDAIPSKILVSEGQKVTAGDTLMVLINEQVQTNFEVAQSNNTAAQKTNDAVRELIAITIDKITKLKRQRKLNYDAFNHQKKELTRNLNYASDKVALDKDKFNNVGLSKLKMDSTLFKNKMISKLEMNNSYDSYLTYRNTLLESENNRNQIQASLNDLESSYLKNENLLDLQLIDADEKLEEYKIEKSTSDKELKTSTENLKFDRETNNKQYIIADLDGEVMNLFNLKYSQNFVNKDELLLSVIPARDKFYAKVTIPQRDIRYVKVGQEAHLKFEAFDAYENGVLKGTVSYVPDAPDHSNQSSFFAVIELSSHPNFKLKSGYAVSGEIITEHLKLYKYIAKKLFRKFDDNTDKTSNYTATSESNNR